ncbi:MAG: SAM-dependent methyltransferase, partial [Alphaproteobacteria bacterium]|nr:SAM-dependent methyltransferase [Alphaproteobacteria bacterium]
MSLETDVKTRPVSRGRKWRLPSLSRPILRRLLAGLDARRLTVIAPTGERLVHTAEAGREAVIELHSWRALRRVVFGGDIGFADAYIAGEWSSPD